MCFGAVLWGAPFAFAGSAMADVLFWSSALDFAAAETAQNIVLGEVHDNVGCLARQASL